MRRGVRVAAPLVPAAFARAAEIGDRFGDRDLATLARHGQGRALIRQGEIARGLRLLARKFPAMADLPPEETEGMAVVEVTPKVISVLDYRKGFGHTDLVKI